MTRLGAVLLMVLAALTVSCDEDDEPAASGDVTLHAAVAAMAREGMVFHAELVFPAEGDQKPRMKVWYWPERELLRTELHDDVAHRSTSIVSREGEVRHDYDDGSVRDDRQQGGQWNPAQGGVAGILPHIGYWGLAPGAVAEAVTVGGRALLRVHAVRVAEEDGHELPKGTTHTVDIYLDPATLLPTHLTVAIDYPNQDEGDVEPYTIAYVHTEFIEAESLPDGFFDQDALVTTSAQGP